MKYGRYGRPYLFARVGLGVTFLLVGVDMWRKPDAWSKFLPENIPLDLSNQLALQVNGLFDILIGVAFIMNLWPRVTAWLAAAHLLGILMINGITSTLMRDVGLLGTCLALAFWPYHRRRNRGWREKLFFWRSTSSSLED